MGLLKALIQVIKAIAEILGIGDSLEAREKSARWSFKLSQHPPINQEGKQEISAEAKSIFQEKENQGLNTGHRLDDRDSAIEEAHDNYWQRQVQETAENRSKPSQIEL